MMEYIVRKIIVKNTLAYLSICLLWIFSTAFVAPCVLFSQTLSQCVSAANVGRVEMVETVFLSLKTNQDSVTSYSLAHRRWLRTVSFHGGKGRRLSCILVIRASVSFCRLLFHDLTTSAVPSSISSTSQLIIEICEHYKRLSQRKIFS